MKTSATLTLEKQPLTIVDQFMSVNLTEKIMKKLANTSPFLLLLLPVFMMIVLTITINTNANDNGEIVVKPAKSSTAIIKQATAIFK
jgi:hypothetical protein